MFILIMAKSTKTPKTSKTNGTASEPIKSVATKTESLKPFAPQVETAKSAAPEPTISLEFVKQGIGALNFEFFTSMPKPAGETGGGMANGTLDGAARGVPAVDRARAP